MTIKAQLILSIELLATAREKEWCGVNRAFDRHQAFMNQTYTHIGYFQQNRHQQHFYCDPTNDPRKL